MGMDTTCVYSVNEDKRMINIKSLGTFLTWANDGENECFVFHGVM